MIVARGFGDVLCRMEELQESPEEVARLAEQRRRFQRNADWYSDHALAIGRDHAGRHICVAGGELFVGGEPREVLAAARAAHPEDEGAVFFKFIRHRREV